MTGDTTTAEKLLGFALTLFIVLVCSSAFLGCGYVLVRGAVGIVTDSSIPPTPTPPRTPGDDYGR